MLDTTSYLRLDDADCLVDKGKISISSRDTSDETDLALYPTTRTMLVPILQSMQDYILKHHKRMILNELNRQLQGGTLAALQSQVNATDNSVFSLRNCTFSEMNFWRQDMYTLLVEVLIDAEIAGDDDVHTHALYCEIWADMKHGMHFVCGETGFAEDKPERDLWMLSSYLVPILRKDEVEKGAEELLLKYIPDAYDNYQS